MTIEQKNKLCELYNDSDIESFDYMFDFLKDNHDPKMLELLERVHTLNVETDIGWGREPASSDEFDEYYSGKWELLNYFGVSQNELGEAYI